MKRVRIRMVDHNGTFASFILPCVAGVSPAQVAVIANNYGVMSMTAQREVDLIDVLGTSTGPPNTGPTSLVMDIAVLTFTGAGPFGLRVPILGPGPIFLGDDITVNPGNEDVIAFVETVLLYGTDRAGNALTAFTGGMRLGAGGP